MNTPIAGSDQCQVCKHSMVQGYDIEAGKPRWFCMAGQMGEDGCKLKEREPGIDG